MAADKRNTSVVIALVVSMTVGAQILFWLEPGKPHWEAATLLQAELARPVQEVIVTYAATLEEADLLVLDPDDSVCWIYPEGGYSPDLRGPRVWLVVIGSDAEQLGQAQQETLLWALGSLNAPGAVEALPVHLDAGSDPGETPGLPAQAANLRELLERKGIIG